MAKFVKLGDRANSFSCPTTGFNISIKGEIKEINNKIEKSKKVKQALQGGHLVYSSQNDFDKQEKAKSKTSKEEEEEEEEDQLHTESSLKKLNREGLLDIANELHEEDDEDIINFNKAQLTEFILNKQEEEEEEEEEE